MLAELEDLVIAAEGGNVKHSQVLNIGDEELMNIDNIRESVDREDDESLESKSDGSNENGEREISLSDEE